MTNLINNAVKNIDFNAIIEQQNRDVLVITQKANQILEALKEIKEDCWLVSHNTIMINRR